MKLEELRRHTLRLLSVLASRTSFAMAGPIRHPIDQAKLEAYLSEAVPEIKTPLEIKQVRSLSPVPILTHPSPPSPPLLPPPPAPSPPSNIPPSSASANPTQPTSSPPSPPRPATSSARSPLASSSPAPHTRSSASTAS